LVNDNAVRFDCDTGPRDIIRHEPNGLLVPQGSVAELITASDRFMSDIFALYSRKNKNISQQAGVIFLIPDNIHPHQNLFIDDAVLLAIYIYSKFHQLLSWPCRRSENP